MSKHEETQQTPIKEANTRFSTSALVWSCKSRLDFLVTVAEETPDLIRHESVFTGFIDTLTDIRELLRLAHEKLEMGEL